MIKMALAVYPFLGFTHCDSTALLEKWRKNKKIKKSRHGPWSLANPYWEYIGGLHANTSCTTAAVGWQAVDRETPTFEVILGNPSFIIVIRKDFLLFTALFGNRERGNNSNFKTRRWKPKPCDFPIAPASYSPFPTPPQARNRSSLFSTFLESCVFHRHKKFSRVLEMGWSQKYFSDFEVEGSIALFKNF